MQPSWKHSLTQIEPKAFSTHCEHFIWLVCAADSVCVCVQGAAAEEKPAWSVLRDDFMMGATMKDWDKDSDGEEAEAHTGGGAEDSD